MVFSDFEPTELSTRLTKSASRKTRKPNCEIWTLKSDFLQQMSLDFDDSSLEEANARLRGWQRITLNSNTTTVTTAAQWDWKRRALTVPLEAFVKLPSC